MNVSIVGTGYVGLTTGACLAFLGHNVTCIDADESKIASLEAGKIPFHEPYLAELVHETRPNLKFTTSYVDSIPHSQVTFIAVGTPPGVNGAPDLKYLESAARGIGEQLTGEFMVVVNKSTVPIGSGHWVASIVGEAYQKKTGKNGEGQFAVASNPEFLREGSAIFDSLYPDRVVVGTDRQRTAEVLYSLYRPLLEQDFRPPSFLPRPDRMGAVPLISTDVSSAELIKYAANAFLALKISYINEIGQLAGRVGADIEQVARGIGLDARIGHRFLQSGIGWGGSCFGKDTAALVSTAAEYGLDSPIVKAARTVNLRQRERVVEILLDELKILKGRTVSLLGLAFKANTDDLREAPALDIAKKLMERGARVKAHDPVAMERFQKENPNFGITCCATPEEAIAGSDATVLVTEWPQYLELDWDALRPKMRAPVILDGRNYLDRPRLTKAGFRVLGLAG